MGSLTIEGKISIFRTLILLKVLYLALLTVTPIHIIDEMVKVQTNFIWKNTPVNIKHKSLIWDHNQGGLKYTDITLKKVCNVCG